MIPDSYQEPCREVGPFTIDVTALLRFPSNADPREGQVSITSGDTTIDVTVVDEDSNGISEGVDVSMSGGDAVFISWNDFDENTLNDPNEQLAAFAFGAYGFLLDQADLVLEAGEIIDLNESGFIPGVPLPVNCDQISPLEPNFSVTLDPGVALFTWDDFGNNGEVDTGDSFALELTECWQDDTSDVADVLINGTLNLNDFFFGGEDENCRILGFGFDNVQYADLVIQETLTDVGACTITSETTVRINGTIFLNFFTVF